jgi:CRP/FNR family transcriptional regulator
MEYQHKELSCLYKADEILSDYELSIDEALQKLVTLLPQAWRYSDSCEASIQWGEKTFQTAGFRNTILKMQSDIVLESKVEGQITIVYTKNMREEKGVFLSGEHQLLKAITTKLNSYLVYHRLQETISSLQVHSSTDGESNKTEQEVINWLRTQDLKEEEIKELLRVKIEFKKGETIFKQGAIASYLILLHSGLSKNYVEGNFDKGFNFKIVKPISFIGLSSVYGKNIYAFSGSALTKCKAYLIDVQTFKSIMSRNHAFTNRILNWYCNTTQSHLNRMSSIANKQALGRLSETLLYLANDIFNGKIITTNVSRKDIAELAAMSTESAVRFLSDLKKDKIIDITSNHIEILKREVLTLLSNN